MSELNWLTPSFPDFFVSLSSVFLSRSERKFSKRAHPCGKVPLENRSSSGFFHRNLVNWREKKKGSLLGLSELGMLLLALIFHLGQLAVIGTVMILGGIVAGLASSLREGTTDTTSWSNRSEDGLGKPTRDKGNSHLAAIPLGRRK